MIKLAILSLLAGLGVISIFFLFPRLGYWTARLGNRLFGTNNRRAWTWIVIQVICTLLFFHRALYGPGLLTGQLSSPAQIELSEKRQIIYEMLEGEPYQKPTVEAKQPSLAYDYFLVIDFFAGWPLALFYLFFFAYTDELLEATIRRRGRKGTISQLAENAVAATASPRAEGRGEVTAGQHFIINAVVEGAFRLVEAIWEGLKKKK